MISPWAASTAKSAKAICTGPIWGRDPGALRSEWPQGTKARSGHFALRKRLELGLIEAVVLVECPLQSKALKTAHLAWQQGLPIWVVPADAGRSSAAGSNRLLGQGAVPLLVPAEFLKQLGQGPLAKASHRAMASKSADLQGREAVLLAALGQGASLEQLCRSLRQNPSGISQRLLKLELAGLVRSTPGPVSYTHLTLPTKRIV